MNLNWRETVNEGIKEQAAEFLLATNLMLNGETFTPLGLSKRLKVGYAQAVRILDFLYASGITDQSGFCWGEDGQRPDPIRAIISQTEANEVRILLSSKVTKARWLN